MYDETFKEKISFQLHVGPPKKSFCSNKCLPKFNFCHDFKGFETVKYVFLQVKKILMDTCVFLIANSRPKFPPVNRQGLFTGGETGPNY